jgi:hypothetical protein
MSNSKKYSHTCLILQINLGQKAHVAVKKHSQGERVDLPGGDKAKSYGSGNMFTGC